MKSLTQLFKPSMLSVGEEEEAKQIVRVWLTQYLHNYEAEYDTKGFEIIAKLLENTTK